MSMETQSVTYRHEMIIVKLTANTREGTRRKIGSHLVANKIPGTIITTTITFSFVILFYKCTTLVVRFF
jgi:hypothetical protein